MQLYSYHRDNNLQLKNSLVLDWTLLLSPLQLRLQIKSYQPWTKAGHLTGAEFIDLTKARPFDTVNHSIVLSKLCSLGVPNASPAYNWFESYLSNRCQVTVCNGTKSSPETVQIGSILGPLLFAFYINDLSDNLDHYDVTLYAYDTVLFISDKLCTMSSPTWIQTWKNWTIGWS